MKSKLGSGGRVNSVKWIQDSKIRKFFSLPFRIKKQARLHHSQENMVDGTKDDLTVILCLRTGSKLGINSYALKHGI